MLQEDFNPIPLWASREVKINRIFIKKLLNKYDVDVDMSDRCRVLIGANGIGKSVTLKIINCILTGNYIDVLFVPYDYVEVTATIRGKDIKCSFRYRDCFPKTKTVIENFSNTVDEQLKDQYVDEFTQMLNELSRLGYYEQFIYCHYKKMEFPANIKKIVNDYIGEYPEFYGEEYSIRNYELVQTEFIGEEFTPHYRYFKDSLFMSSSMYSYAFHIFYGVYYYDFVKKHELNNSIRYNSLYICMDKEWIYAQRELLKKHIDIKKKIDLMEVQDSTYDIKYSVMENCKKELEQNNSFRINDIINILFYDKEIVTKVNNIAIRYAKEYYDIIDILYSNEKLCKALCNYNIRIKFNIEKIGVYTKFIRPILVKNSFFDYDLEALSRLEEDESEDNYLFWDTIIEYSKEYHDNNKEKCDYLKSNMKQQYCKFIDIVEKSTLNELNIKKKDQYSLDGVIDIPYRDFMFLTFNDSDRVLQYEVYEKLLVDFIDEVTPILLNESNKSEIIKQFQNTVQKYLIDRVVDICPAGCFINNKIDNKEQQWFSIYSPYNIDLSNLSSGEKKIILLLGIAIFFDDIILLDEPELSLSLVWQEQLLPDLVKLGNSTIVCATHSPYIVNDESVQKYIKYIP